jgi:hypothetical protein
MAKSETSVEAAEKVLAELQNKRQAVAARVKVNADRRQEIGYDVHAGDDKAARQTLDKLIADSVVLSGELESLDGAIKPACARLVQVRRTEAVRAERANALRLRGELRHFEECAAKLDVAFATIADVGREFHDVAARMHSLGAPVPSGQQVDSLGYRSLLTVIAASPWARHFDHVAPNERRTFSQLVAIWVASNERAIAARLEQEEHAA